MIDKQAQSYRPGNKDDFDSLYRSTYQRIFATLVIILKSPAAAEDATQEAYLRAFRAWRRWKQDAPAEAWLFRIALNLAFTQRRRERLFEIGAILQRLGRPADPDPTDSMQSDLFRELRALPPKQASAIVLRHLHGFTNREIAAVLNVPERTVASRLAVAKGRLRNRLGDRMKDEMGTSMGQPVPLEE